MTARTSASAASVRLASFAVPWGGADRRPDATGRAQPEHRPRHRRHRSKPRRCGAGSCLHGQWHCDRNAATALPGGPEHFCHRRLQPLMGVGDHRRYTTQAALGQAVWSIHPYGQRACLPHGTLPLPQWPLLSPLDQRPGVYRLDPHQDHLFQAPNE